MNRPTTLLKALLHDAGLLIGTDTTRDESYCSRRIKHEGISFLTITLPVLSDFLERGIETGQLSPELSCTFAFERRRRLPKFLSGFFSRVFDSDGMLLINACPNSIYAIRQVSRSFKKIFEICDDRKNAAAAERYKTVEKELECYDHIRSKEDFVLDGVSRYLCLGFGTELRSEDFLCGHGPGATAERRSANGRISISRWPSRSDRHFPVDLHALPNLGTYEDLEGVQMLEEHEEPPVRVVFVPKTALTPRVIAIEPSHMQYMQQGVMRYMVRKLERFRLTRGHINFADQTVNQKLARVSSLNRRLATVDLKDASDRVHIDLFRRIFRYSPLKGYLESSRSAKASLPSGDIIKLRKFASMGSATCFPVEAFVFYALVIAALHHELGIIPSFDTVRRLSRDVYVYGDDIVCPSSSVSYVCDYLESYGLLVNRNKSFSKSHFRESCGADYYKGTPVKPVYFRQHLPKSFTLKSPAQLLAWVSSANQLYRAGMWKSAQTIRNWVDSDVFPLPKSVADNGILTHESFFLNTNVTWNGSLYSYGQRGLFFKPKLEEDPCLTYSGALLKALANIGQENKADFDFSTRRGVLVPKRRWASLRW